jgi:RimJ/RimL family protein N-acetyltransferase
MPVCLRNSAATSGKLESLTNHPINTYTMSQSSAQWELNTERLRISRLQSTNEHARFLCDLYNSPLFLAGQGATGIDTDEKALKMMAGFVDSLFSKQSHGIYLVSLRDANNTETQPKIGTVSVMIGGTHTVPDIGFALLPQYTGMGYAQEAGKAMVSYAVEEAGNGGLGYDGAFAFTSATNAQSRKACESLDMEFRGIYPLKAFGGGKSAVYAMKGMSEDLRKYGVVEERLEE